METALEIKRAGFFAAYMQAKAYKQQCNGSTSPGPGGHACSQAESVMSWCVANVTNPLLVYVPYADLIRAWPNAAFSSPYATMRQGWVGIVGGSDPYMLVNDGADAFAPLQLPLSGHFMAGGSLDPAGHALWETIMNGPASHYARRNWDHPSFWTSFRNNFVSAIVTGGEMILAAFCIAEAAGAAYAVLEAGGTTAGATAAASTTAVSGGAVTPIVSTAAVTTSTTGEIEAAATAAASYGKKAYEVYSTVKAIKAQRAQAAQQKAVVAQNAKVAAENAAAYKVAQAAAAAGSRPVSLVAAKTTGAKLTANAKNGEHAVLMVGAVVAAKVASLFL